MSQAPQVPLLKTFFITRPFQSSLVLVVYLLCKIDAHVQIQSSISFTLWNLEVERARARLDFLA